MNNFEKSILVLSMNALFLLGAYALRPFSWVLAVISLGMVFFLFYYVHRIRVCNFCRQDCPYRPAKPNPRLTRVGFSKVESILFFGVFGIFIVLDLVAVTLFSLYIGIAIALMLVYIGFVYRKKVCVHCDLPCPINPNSTSNIPDDKG